MTEVDYSQIPGFFVLLRPVHTGEMLLLSLSFNKIS